MSRFGVFYKQISRLSLHNPLKRTTLVPLSLARSVCSNSHFNETVLKERESWVVLSDDGNTILCWHPEVPFPYEHSKPLPYIEPELREEDSVLKLKYRLDQKHREFPDGPSDKELEKLTFTNKHQWLHKPSKKYRKPNQPRDRDGI